MKIVFLDLLTIGKVPNLFLIGKLGDFIHYPSTSAGQTIERVKDAEVIITNKVIIDKEVIDNTPHLKLVCIAATGMNNVDLEYAKQKGIGVKNVSDYSTESVAQSTFAILLQLINRTHYYDHYVKSGNYANSEIFTHHGRDFWQLKDKRFGIIGMGNIGRRVAAIAETFGAEVVYYSTSGHNLNQAYQHLSLPDLLSTSDVVSIHAPLNEITKGLIAYDELKIMKPGAYLINMGRGGIVVEADLARALNENLIAGAGLDVYCNEPIEKDNPMLHIHNTEKIVFTPHVAWASIEARTMLLEKIYQNIKSYKEGRTKA